MPWDPCGAPIAAHLFLDLLANISRTQGSVGLHQDHAARFREAGLAPVALAIDQLQQFIAQHIIAKEVGQSGQWFA